MEKRYCENCKEELKEDDKFCQNCGTKVKDVEIKKTIEEDKKDEKVETPIEKSENEIKVSNSEEQKKKNKMVMYGIIVTILLVIVSLILLFFIIKDGDKSNSNDKKENDTEEKTDKNDDGKNNEDENKKDDENEKDNKLEDLVLQNFESGNIVDFYYRTSYTADNMYTITKPEYTSKSIGKIRLENKDCKIFDNFYRFDSNGNVVSNITLYRDGDKLKIYDYKLNKGIILNIDSSFEKYKLVVNPNWTHTINDILGIDIEDGIEKDKYYSYGEITNVKLSLFYDIRKDKELLKNQNYYEFSYVNSKMIQAYSGYGNKQKVVLLNLNDQKEMLSVEPRFKERCHAGFSSYGDNFITFSEQIGVECTTNYTDFYTKDLKLFIKKGTPNFLALEKGNLFYMDDTTVHKYDKKGNEINKYEYDKILDLIGNYLLVVENNKLLLKDNKNMSVVLGEWKDSYKYHKALSGQYGANPQIVGYYQAKNQLYKESEKQEGLYFVIETNRDEENKKVSGVEYYFNTDTKEVKKYDLPTIESREGYILF